MRDTRDASSFPPTDETARAAAASGPDAGSQTGPPSDGTTPTAEGAPERDRAEIARNRRVLAVTAALTALVMGGMLFFAWQARQGDAETLPQLPSNAYRPVQWQDDRCRPDPDHPARIVFDLPDDRLDFGEIKQNEVLDAVVTFRSAGEAPLCVSAVRTGCGCVKARLLDERGEPVRRGEVTKYEPGTTAQIAVHLDSTGRSGTVEKYVTVRCNELAGTERRFVVAATITAGVLADPGSLNFGRVTLNRPAEAKVRLLSKAPLDTWEITEVVGDPRPSGGTGEEDTVHYTFDVRDIAVAEGHARELLVTHPGWHQEGEFIDNVKVRTTHPDTPEILLPAYLTVAPPLYVRPLSVMLGFVSADASEPGPPWPLLVLPGDDTIDFKITGLRFLGPDGEPLPPGTSGFVATHDVNEDGVATVEVRYDGKPRPHGPIRSILEVATDLEAMKTLRIDCHATVTD